MKPNITRNLALFAALTLVYSLAFYASLYWALTNQQWTILWACATGYGALMLITGKTLGEKDKLKNSYADLGFNYHLTTFLVVNIVGIIWIISFRPNDLIYQIISTLSWLIGLLIHFLESSKSLKGYSKEESFK